MRILIRRPSGVNGMPEREFTWTVADTEPLFAFHAHAKDTLLVYEARPYNPTY